MTGLEQLGWDDTLARAYAAWAGKQDIQPGRILIEFNYIYRAWGAGGETEAVLAGRLKHRATSRGELPAVGDWVAIRKRPEEDRGAIVGVLPRRSWFSRRMAGKVTDEQVVAANVDVVFLVMALDLDFSLTLRERGYRNRLVPDLPLVRHAHTDWERTPEEERERLSKRNFYRFLKKHGHSQDVLVANARN